MKLKFYLIPLLLLSELHSAYGMSSPLNEADSVYLFSYATTKNNNHNGLHFAWSRDRETWFAIGNEFSYLKSDYGQWGAEKRMITPYVMQDVNGLWHCVWSLNERDNLFAHAASDNLVDWGRQSYPTVRSGSNCLSPVIQFDGKKNIYTIRYTTAEGKTFVTTTADFKVFSPVAETGEQQLAPVIAVKLPGGVEHGQIHRVSSSLVDHLIKTYQQKQFRNEQNHEKTIQDPQRFAGLGDIDATLNIEADKTKAISDMLMGIFFEDINYAADGGLYAELIQNRDFEYSPADRNNDKTWTRTHSWTLKGAHTTFSIDTTNAVHANNYHYALLDTKSPGAALVNSGFDGIVVRAGEKYDFSIFAKRLDKREGVAAIRLVDENGNILANATVKIPSGDWKKIKAVLTATASSDNARLEIEPTTSGQIAFDMISLFPQKTFHNRKNGLRADLAQTIADLHPRFVRFPGGCVAHGDGLGNMYRWKNTLGPLETRKPQRNLWNYHQTAGLGYFEYFQFCEDIGATPVPVLPAGVPCQNSSTGGGGQQGGIPMDDMDDYVQEVLDLIEYANGDVKTPWGKKRAEAGHPKPFNLKYIGIGNEDLITDIFEERFTMIFNAVKEKHPEITVIGTVGPFYEGTDYVEGWKIASKLNVPMVDEHYYQPPAWFIHNQDFYDKYDRSKSKVYLGEYAAHLPGRPNNIETALSEALYLTALERNGDVVTMSSYAPLLAKEEHTQWSPDLIYFNNKEVKPTVGYLVQKLYGTNAGDQYIHSTVSLSNNQDAVRKRVAVSVVKDTQRGDLMVKLVNMLPVTVRTNVKIENAGPLEPVATRTVLTGKPDDKQAMLLTDTPSVGENFQVILPPYSFTVIRLKKK